ncbi:MAG: methanogenesis marker 16 metalloprotein [Methanoregula sp.]|jgi:putative methanogenesis marker 16 metalloprotein|nr:methanogenesis marker 16 metalloprotein [Methanoregula sp.]
MKTIDLINRKIAAGTAVVCTAAELKQRIAEGETVTAADIDVVTTGTFGVMSGTLAVLHIPVTATGTFRHAEKVLLNGVPALPGPCPNEGLGSVDLVVYGTARANAAYGGGHLFCDIVAGKEIAVDVESAGNLYSRTVTLADMGLARLITTRSAFRNYLAVTNTRPGTIQTIFSVKGLTGPYTEASVSGCGDINPLQNDPGFRVIGSGVRILLNGGTGYVMGTGTRSSREKPNIAAYGDMHAMMPAMMGGFVTSAGPECNTSVAIPFPVLDDTVLDGLRITNKGIPLPVADVSDRIPFTTASYADVWDGTDLAIIFSGDSCVQCNPCAAAQVCPTGAITPLEGIDLLRCVNCGTCVRECPANAFSANLGSLPVGSRNVPITLRQSDRARALRLCTHLKDLILDRKFSLTGKMEDLV